jgi:hypothetical protein
MAKTSAHHRGRYKKAAGLTHSLKITDEEPLDPVIYKARRCLYCMGVFESTGPGNRLCGPCKRNIDRHR